MPTALFTLPAAVATLTFCVSALPAAGPTTAPYGEKYRPQFHFTAERDWLNDPNGLVFYEGEYHLFFQRAPGRQTSDGNMSWGHAVSTDLLHWTQLPDALMPDAAGPIWSGSVVVDWQNTSGFGENGKPPLIALYTTAKPPFTQSLAYSNDRGRTWAKYAGNPVLPNVHGTNRDPKVIWHAPTRQWIMALFLDRPSAYGLYFSDVMNHWRPLQNVTLEGDTECPDFFPLNVDGDPNRQKWVFTGAAGKYVIGSFDGKTFTPESDVLCNEHGPSFYAAQTFSDTTDGRRIQIGWMRDGKYPGMPFNQQMSFPCELTLRTTPRGVRLFRLPVKEIETLYARTVETGPMMAAKAMRDQLAIARAAGLTAADAREKAAQQQAVTGELLDVSIKSDFLTPGERTITFRGLPVRLHTEGDAVVVSCLGRRFSLAGDARQVSLRILVDRTSIEIFADGGATVFSGCFLPTDGAPPMTREPAAAAIIDHITVHELKSAWPAAK